jgi:hypothetical protein
MRRKGKFKLFSYLVDDFLIYYKSFNKNKKIIAFSIIEDGPFSPIFLILKHFLNLRFLEYFSFQIHNHENFLFILCFEDYSPSKILRYFNIIYNSK